MKFNLRKNNKFDENQFSGNYTLETRLDNEEIADTWALTELINQPVRTANNIQNQMDDNLDGVINAFKNAGLNIPMPNTKKTETKSTLKVEDEVEKVSEFYFNMFKHKLNGKEFENKGRLQARLKHNILLGYTLQDTDKNSLINYEGIGKRIMGGGNQVDPKQIRQSLAKSPIYEQTTKKLGEIKRESLERAQAYVSNNNETEARSNRVDEILQEIYTERRKRGLE